MNKYKEILDYGCGDNSCMFVKPKRVWPQMVDVVV
jgi:hypothetical protein